MAEPEDGGKALQCRHIVGSRTTHLPHLSLLPFSTLLPLFPS